MFEPVTETVPSLELGPSSPPSWEMISSPVGSPTGPTKTAQRRPASGAQTARYLHSARSLRYEQSCLDLTSLEPTSPTTSVTPLKTTGQSSPPILASCVSSQRAKRRQRVLPSSSSSLKVVEHQELTVGDSILSRAVSCITSVCDDEFLPAASAMEIERQVTDEFTSEFWGDLSLDLPQIPNDKLTDCALTFDESPFADIAPLSHACPAPSLPDPGAASAPADLSQLINDVDDDLLLQLASSFDMSGTGLEVEASAAEESPAVLPSPAAADTEAAPAPETVTGSTVDLSAVLEQADVVFQSAGTEPAESFVSPTTPSPSLRSVTLHSVSPVSLLPSSPAAPVRRCIVTRPSRVSSVSPSPSPSLSAGATPSPVVLQTAAATPLVTVHTPAKADLPATRYILVVTSNTTTSSSSGDTQTSSPRQLKRPASPSPSPAPATPAEKYRRIRDRNNEASRVSRQRRKVRQAGQEQLAERLELENEQLRERAEQLQRLVQRVRQLVVPTISRV